MRGVGDDRLAPAHLPPSTLGPDRQPVCDGLWNVAAERGQPAIEREEPRSLARRHDRLHCSAADKARRRPYKFVDAMQEGPLDQQRPGDQRDHQEDEGAGYLLKHQFRPVLPQTANALEGCEVVLLLHVGRDEGVRPLDVALRGDIKPNVLRSLKTVVFSDAEKAPRRRRMGSGSRERAIR